MVLTKDEIEDIKSEVRKCCRTSCCFLHSSVHFPS